MRKKMRRTGKRHGQGWKKSKSGSKGGTGNASLWDSKISTRILRGLKVTKKSTSIEAIESKLERFLRKKVAVPKKEEIYFPCGFFCKKYSKILSVGQASKKYNFCNHVKLSSKTKLKLEG